MTNPKPRSPRHWDVFICHASEDKGQVARPLAESLRAHGLRVWYDEFSLNIGDSLRRKIEQGLARSKLGVVIVSPDFLGKEWPQRELDMLVSLEVNSGRKRILPVWHNVDDPTIAKYSLGLADRVAAKTSEGLDNIAAKIVRVVLGHRVASPDSSKLVGEDSVNEQFKRLFSTQLVGLANELERKQWSSTEQEDWIDSILMLVKDRIDNWDVPSVRFATRELFLNLYAFEAEGIIHNLYVIFQDLFSRAYSQRRRLLAEMIRVFNRIMLDVWIKSEDSNKGESAAKVLVRLGLDFLVRDVRVVKDCLMAIDNLAGDYFAPEILSKEILLTCAAFTLSKPSKEIHNLVEEAVDWIRVNDQYAWDAGIYTYLRDAIDQAEVEQEGFAVEIMKFKDERLYPILNGNIESQIESLVGYMSHDVDPSGDLSYAIENLAQLITAYESIRPAVAIQIRDRILEGGTSNGGKIFNKIISGSAFLKAVYGQGQMITTFEEFVRFIESNADVDNSKIGFTTFGISWVEFVRNIKDKEKGPIQEILIKYRIKEDVDITENRLMFTMDELVYLNNDTNDMRQLISFLRDLNKLIGIKGFASSFDFQLRRLTPP